MYTVHTADTPNGIKIPIALEELGLPYVIVPVDLAAGAQHAPQFLAMNPNGRIPVLVDDQGPSGLISVFESGAILLYLAERHGRLLPTDPVERVRAMEYLFLQVAGVGPMFGQASWFRRSAPQPVPIALDRYIGESKRLAGVLEQRLAQAPWLGGESHSVADIAHFGWMRIADYAGVSLAGCPAVRDWLQRMEARPAVRRARARLDLATRANAVTHATEPQPA